LRVESRFERFVLRQKVREFEQWAARAEPPPSVREVEDICRHFSAPQSVEDPSGFLFVQDERDVRREKQAAAVAGARPVFLANGHEHAHAADRAQFFDDRHPGEIARCDVEPHEHRNAHRTRVSAKEQRDAQRMRDVLQCTDFEAPRGGHSLDEIPPCERRLSLAGRAVHNGDVCPGEGGIDRVEQLVTNDVGSGGDVFEARRKAAGAPGNDIGAGY
jgi:hypothetical protein